MPLDLIADLGHTGARRDRALDRLEALRPHLRLAEEKVNCEDKLPGPAGVLRHLLLTGLLDLPRRLLHGLDTDAAASWLDQAASMIRQGSVKSATRTLVNVLALDPANSRASALLDDLKALPGSNISAIRARYCLRHIRSFGARRLALPVNAAVHAPSGSILVADQERPHITVFSASGRPRAALDLGLSWAGGLAPDGRDTFIVCDRLNRRLIRFDITGRILAVFDVRAADSSLGDVYPGHARPFGRNGYALLATSLNFDRFLIGGLTGGVFTPWHVTAAPTSSLNVVGGRIVSRDYLGGRLFRHAGPGGTPAEIALDYPRLYTNFSFASSSQGIFMDFSGAMLAKFDRSGKLVFLADLRKLYGRATSILDIKVFTRQNTEMLCLTDSGNHRIHIVAVQEPATREET